MIRRLIGTLNSGKFLGNTFYLGNVGSMTPATDFDGRQAKVSMETVMSEYYEILVETFVEPGGRGVRVRPLERQEFPTNMRVECCKEMRSNHPVGTVFKIMVKKTKKPGYAEHLYSSYRWPYEVVGPKLSPKRN